MPGTQSPHTKALETIRAILKDPSAFQNGKPVFRTVAELDQYLHGKGFRLTANDPFGPDQPDARQMIYQGPNNVILKIKTRGYKGGPRMGRATLSLEVTDGKGTGWDNARFKVDARGQVIAKNLINEAELAPRADGSPGVKRASGKVEPFSPFEVIQGGRSQPMNKDKWADAGHLDLPDGFNAHGAQDLELTEKRPGRGPKPPTGGGPKSPLKKADGPPGPNGKPPTPAGSPPAANGKPSVPAGKFGRLAVNPDYSWFKRPLTEAIDDEQHPAIFPKQCATDRIDSAPYCCSTYVNGCHTDE